MTPAQRFAAALALARNKARRSARPVPKPVIKAVPLPLCTQLEGKGAGGCTYRLCGEGHGGTTGVRPCEACGPKCDDYDAVGGRELAGPVRVAFLSPSLLMGGAERWMISLARHCDPARIQWVGCATTTNTADPAVRREMAALMPVDRPLSKLLAAADVVLTWGVGDLSKRMGGSRVPTVFVSHGSCHWGRDLAAASAPAVTHFAAVSEAALGPVPDARRKGAAVIPNGIDADRCTPAVSRADTRAAWGFTDAHAIVGYVGRYSPEKNAAAAAQAVAAIGGDFRAVYAGAGWAEADTRAAVRKTGARAVFVPADRQVGTILAGLDCFVLASPAEGFSLALAEAWLCGVPTVATRVGAVPELERKHGPLVSPVPVNPTPDQLAAAVRYAVSNEFRATVDRARAVVAAHYTAARMGERWTDYLCRVAAIPLGAT